MNRLANVEAYRLSSVVDEALESLRFLSRLTSDDVSKLAHVDGSFNNQLKSETRFKALFEESIRMDRRPKELDGAGAAVRASTKEICRAIKTRQQLANAVNDQCRAEESDGMANIINTLTDLKKIVRIKLCTTVEQEETKNENIAALTMRAKDAQKDVEEFEIQLRIERNKKEKNLSKFNDIITKLNAELEGLKEKTENGRNRLKNETDEARATNKKLHEERMKEYEERLAKLNESEMATSKEHSSAEDTARKTKMKLETEVVNWVTKYDAEMNERQDAINTLNKQYDIEKAELRQLSEFFAKIDRDLANEEEEKAEAEGEKERLRMAMQRVYKAASKMQALVRGVQLRVAEAKRKKKGGKGKKKK
jgi:chromosome segregation ATPase|eukprot:Stramenopile-MAST_4_protein_2748